MKKLISLVALSIILVGCSTTQRRVAYNTLYSVHVTTDLAFNGYMNEVVNNRIKTNSLPQIAHDYSLFQAGWNAALFVAQNNTNSFASENVIKLSNIVIDGVNTARKGIK